MVYWRIFYYPGEQFLFQLPPSLSLLPLHTPRYSPNSKLILNPQNLRVCVLDLDLYSFSGIFFPPSLELLNDHVGLIVFL